MRTRRAIALAAAAAAAIGAAPQRGAAPEGLVPCKVTGMVEPAYPPQLLAGMIVHGEARLLLRIDARGRLVDALATAYSEKEFADEALRAVRRWTFEPSRLGGEPVASDLHVAFRFDVRGVMAIARTGPLDDAEFMEDWTRFRPVPLRRLDRPPTAVSAVSPVYPEAWAAKGIRGRVVVQFYIDEEGRVRLPVVLSADDPGLGSSALDAVSRWRFLPPTERGRPALVIARQTFRFGAAAEPAQGS